MQVVVQPEAVVLACPLCLMGFVCTCCGLISIRLLLVFTHTSRKLYKIMRYQSDVYKTAEAVVPVPHRAGDLGVGMSDSPKER